MPYDHSPSPVAPTASSRLWTAGASGGVAILVMAVLAVMKPELAGWLAAGALAVAVATWVVNRNPPTGMDETTFEPGAVDLGPDAALLGDAFEALDDPLLIISGGEADDIAGRRIALANAAARELFKLSGTGGGLLVSVIRDPRVLEAVDEALFGGIGGEVDYVGGGVQERYWKALIRPLPVREDSSWGDGALTLLALRDETDVRRMEKMRVDFLANASHELRTPLASLSGFIETLKGHARDDPKARDKFLDIMAVQADRMRRLVADLLSLSRIELNEHIAPLGRVNLARAAADVVDAVSVISRERQVTIHADLPHGGAAVIGDRDEIAQVVQNLIDNALKYSSAGGTIEIGIEIGRTLDEAMSARMPEGNRLSLATPDRETGLRYAVVTVRDHGPGMAREHLPRLTERFYRVEGQKSGDRQGTGLGLAIVRHIIIRHRGGLSVDSAPGCGAIFAACFPLAPSSEN